MIFKEIYFVNTVPNGFSYQVPRHNGLSWINLDFDISFVKTAIAAETCNIEIQTKFATDADVHVRCALASNSNLIPELQHKLATDTKWTVRSGLAQNPNLIPELKGKIKYDI